MNNKGVTIVELLIVIVVIGIIAAFSVVSVGAIIETTREGSFVNTANAMIDAAALAHNQNDDLWDDNVATLQELITGDYIIISDEDPWGLPYDKVNSVVTIGSVLNISEGYFLSTSIYLASGTEFKVKLVSGTATIGFDVALADFDENNIVYLNGESGGVVGIVETVTGTLRTTITGDNDNDTITVSGSASNGANINTNGGNDTVSIGVDFTGNAKIDTGTGNDTVTISRDLKSNASVSTGDGDDTITVERWIRGNAKIYTGAGNDIISIIEIRYRTITNAGDGNDTVTIDSVLGNFSGTVDMGAGDDNVTISDSGTPFSGVNGSFKGGSGNDTLTLPTVNNARWNQISHLFSGFETIILTDTTITT